jgi:hypothetical protein
MDMEALDGVKELGHLGHTFCGHLHVERHGVLVGVDLDAGQLSAVLVYVFPIVSPSHANTRTSLLA